MPQNLNPQNYAASSVIQKNVAKNVLTEFGLKLKWKGQDTLLDIGCGPGNVTVDLVIPIMPKTYKRVVGVDVGDASIEYARETYCRDYKNLEFYVADITKLQELDPFEGKFDHVVSFGCLQWIKDEHQGQAFSNISRMLKPGGDYLLQAVIHFSLYSIYEQMHNTTKWAKFMEDYLHSPYQNEPDPVARVKSYMENNFQGEYELHVKIYPFVFQDVAEYKSKLGPYSKFFSHFSFIDFLTGVNRFTAINTPELLEDYLSDIIEHSKKMGLFVGETVVFHMKHLIIFGTKQA